MLWVLKFHISATSISAFLAQHIYLTTTVSHKLIMKSDAS